MRIGILSPSYPPNRAPCSIGDFTKMLVPELVRAGVEVAVFTGEDYGGPGEAEGAKVLRLARGWGPASLTRIARAARDEKIGPLLVQYAPDLYPPSSAWIHFLPLAMRCLAPGVRTVLSMHTVGGPDFASKAGAGLMLATSTAILNTNEEVTSLIGKYMLRALRKLGEVPIGANIEPAGGAERRNEARKAARDKVRVEEGLSPEGFILAHFGFYYPGKGAGQILEAAGRPKEGGRDFRLFMIGGRRADDEGFYPRLQERAGALGLGGDVVWTGYVPDERVSEILLAADMFLAPFEGGVSPRRGSLMAAIAHGLPLVSTPSKIETRYFRAGENFAPVPFGDARALAVDVSALMADPARRDRLRAGAGALADVFSWPSIALRTRDFLDAVLSGRSPGAGAGQWARAMDPGREQIPAPPRISCSGRSIGEMYVSRAGWRVRGGRGGLCPEKRVSGVFGSLKRIVSHGLDRSRGRNWAPRPATRPG